VGKHQATDRNLVKSMAKNKARNSKVKRKKGSKKIPKPTKSRKQGPQARPVSKPPEKVPTSQNVSPADRSSPSQPLDDSRVFTIEIDSIRAETTIGDLIVAFPRTRDVLMKHGLRFDVEEAGYLYMTLNVFSAIHGLVLAGLLQELDVASKEMPLPPLAAPPARQIVIPPTN
jgi:hypothetical protein